MNTKPKLKQRKVGSKTEKKPLSFKEQYVRWEFLEYFRTFYGPKGLYHPTIPNYTDTQVLAGIACRGTQFRGDSFDRECIRDMILILNNKPI